MANAYSLVYSEHAADVLISLERHRLESLIYDLRNLAAAPFVRSDYVLNNVGLLFTKCRVRVAGVFEPGVNFGKTIDGKTIFTELTPT